jgi:hypothetical protein
MSDVADAGGSFDVYWYALVLFGGVWAWFAVPYAWHCLRAVRARNAWLPFERNARGRYTFMAAHRWHTAFRAPVPERRTTLGLVIRYCVWAWVVAALSYVPVDTVHHMLTH